LAQGPGFAMPIPGIHRQFLKICVERDVSGHFMIGFVNMNMRAVNVKLTGKCAVIGTVFF